MIAVDTNLLVYAHRADSPWHEAARARCAASPRGGRRWAIPWPCLHEFLAIVTHPRIYDPPTPVDQAPWPRWMPGLLPEPGAAGRGGRPLARA